MGIISLIYIFKSESRIGYPDQSSTYTDIFIAKFNSVGNLIWLKTAGSSLHDYPDAIAIDEQEIYMFQEDFKTHATLVMV